MTRPFALSICILALLVACDSSESAESESPAIATTFETPSKLGGDEAHTHEEGHDGHNEGVHLGAHMYELSRRFAAVWYAGKAGNSGMLDYQLHEMHEVIEELEEARPTEAGVDVVARLESDVESHFEKLEQAVEEGDQKEFESTYLTIMGNCTSCHADTKHAFIQVKKPEYNPYSNLTF